MPRESFAPIVSPIRFPKLYNDLAASRDSFGAKDQPR